MTTVMTELDYLTRISAQLTTIEQAMYIALVLTAVLIVIYVIWVAFKDFL